MTLLIPEMDRLATRIGARSLDTAPGSWERLFLMPALMGVLVGIVAQESVRVLLGLPRQVGRLTGLFPALVAPENALLTFGVAMALLLLGGILVYRRSMSRAYAAGLDQ